MTLSGALLSHYRRHPLQFLALLLILLIATALWSGVWSLSQQARASFSASDAALAQRHVVLRNDGVPVGVSDFVRLRRLGVCVTPQLVVERPAPQGRLIGIDAFSLACFAAQSAPNARAHPGVFVDIGEAEAIAGTRWPTRLTLFIDQTTSGLPSDYRIEQQPGTVATEQLADSFLLNLDALCALVLLISALLVRSVFVLGMTQREASLVLLQRHGVTAQRIRWHLVVEITLFALLGGGLGLVLGRVLARGFAAGFDQVLSGLFSVSLYTQTASVLSWLAPLLMLVIVMIWAVADRLFEHQPSRHKPAQMTAAWLTLATGVGVVLLLPSLTGQFAGIALVLAGYGWLTTLNLPLLLERLARRSASPLLSWSWSEVSAMVRQLALPLAALQFAAATVIAVHALVATFESTFYQWLDQRLQGDVYVQAPPALERQTARQRLASLASVSALHSVLRGRAQSRFGSLDVMAIESASPLLRRWEFLSTAVPGDTGVADASAGTPTDGDTVWRAVAAGQVLINEQLSRRHGLAAGNAITLTLGTTTMTATIAAVYADYGRPAGEVVIDQALWPENWPYQSSSFAVRLRSGGVESFQQQLAQAWQTSDVKVRDNEAIRTLAVRIFDQTFALTRAISTMTLLLAGVALLLMALTLFASRSWYYQLLQVWGLSATQVRGWLIRHGLLLTGAIALIALPLGVFLTWVLVARINPLAFGWSLPMATYPGFWLMIVALSLAVGLVLAVLLAPQIALSPASIRRSTEPHHPSGTGREKKAG
ncbi:FtsX-like permease family protein [Marinobacter caseinilyticus]|uniref:FtsX-like permease family protein n=1 Tax=Marinobacter caseinilyticus TaxID=2692195 RepID=UPI00140806D9|nr:ABC transporter permease [Marinobacter caseinilyticus]